MRKNKKGVLGNQKGEVVTITVVAAAIVVGLLGFFGRPVVDKVLPIFGGQQKQVTTQTVQYKPVMVKIDDGTKEGKWITAQRIEENINNFKGDEKVTFGSWVKSLATLWFVLSMLGACGVPFIGIWWANFKNGAKTALAVAKTEISKIQSDKDGLTAKARQIVISVDAGLGKIDEAINIAKAKITTSQEMINSASLITDAALRDTTLKTAQESLSRAQSLFNILIELKKSFKEAMYAEQDTNTVKLVSELLQNDDTNLS